MCLIENDLLIIYYYLGYHPLQKTLHHSVLCSPISSRRKGNQLEDCLEDTNHWYWLLYFIIDEKWFLEFFLEFIYFFKIRFDGSMHFLFYSRSGVVWFSFNASFDCSGIRALVMTPLKWWFDGRLVGTWLNLKVTFFFSVFNTLRDTIQGSSGTRLIKRWSCKP